jgi:diguanylate cyclase (GGDEF)-like protein
MAKNGTDSHTQTIAEDFAYLVIHEKMPFLIVYVGKDAGKRFQLKRGRNTIGRSSEADIVIDDELASRVHCAISCVDDEVVLEDCGSKNGTYVDAKKTERRRVTTESTIQVGRTVMRVEFKDKAQVEHEQTLFLNATIDSLTGIPNRFYLMRRLREELPLARRSGRAISLIMMDVDKFKAINDSLGHPAGDHVLKEVASLLRTGSREEDIIGRYGGDEFIAMLRGEVSQEGAFGFCERIRQRVETAELRFEGHDIAATLSIGLCYGQPSAEDTADSLIARADSALYAAKQKGRNRTECEVA